MLTYTRLTRLLLVTFHLLLAAHLARLRHSRMEFSFSWGSGLRHVDEAVRGEIRKMIEGSWWRRSGDVVWGRR